MYATNKRVRIWLLNNEYDEIWFKPHSARNDLVFTKKGNYLATDLWNLFDGLCYYNGVLIYLQMKTNAWAKEKPLKDFVKSHSGIIILSFNVTNKLAECRGHYKVCVRRFA